MSIASRASSLAHQWARRLLSLLQWPVIRVRRTRMMRQSARGSTGTSKRWRRRRLRVTILEIFSYLGAITLVVVVVWSIVAMFTGPGILTGLNSAAASTVRRAVSTSESSYRSFQWPWPRRYSSSPGPPHPVVKKAKTMPQHVVETATPDTGAIVGRDELCRVIMEDIRHPDNRRPHLLVGGVGTGKTAVLVRLTSLLAECRAFPIPIRLRDATDSVNFQEMAHTRFLAVAEGSMRSADDAEKVWRQLSKDDMIVVIADGLEEALTEGTASVHEDRDNLIRRAIHQAREVRLPLIIASRPHGPLRGADATIMELEPLSEEAALEYIDPGQNSADARWLDWIVQTAGLTELPLYLQITRQLSRSGRLDYLPAERSARVDMRSMDHSKLRLYLLDTWMQALLDGHLMGAVPLNRGEREAAVEWLSALACIGMIEDTIDVKYDDYYKGERARQLEVSQTPKYPEIDREIQSFPGEEASSSSRHPAGRHVGRPAPPGGGARRRPAFPAQHHAGVSRLPFHAQRPAGQQIPAGCDGQAAESRTGVPRRLGDVRPFRGHRPERMDPERTRGGRGAPQVAGGWDVRCGRGDRD